ncbi:MAG: tRNA 2-thiouridine(34) synthase MnmA [Planctomycetota bacterium]
MSEARDRFVCSGRDWRPRGNPADAIAVLMSGGVDSSVAAAKLLHAGRELVGITMLIPSALGPDCAGAELRACCGQGAARVAGELGLPHYFVDVRDEFREQVIARFRAAYRRGRTPSPCIDCNTFIKFGVVMDLLRQTFGIEQVATGHYARIERADGTARLYAVRHRKDQSYFLYGIPGDRLRRVVFPLADQTKDETRREARRRGLGAAEHAESADLCFAGQDDYRAALGPNPDAGPGDVLDLDGNVIGRHRGISNYTYGQRGGLGIAAGIPLYVVDIDPTRNTVTLGDRDAARRRDVCARHLNILAPDQLAVGSRLFGKVRAHQRAGACRATEIADDRLVVRFETPQHGVAPGQHLVLYSESGQVIAGGEIVRPPR